MLNDQAKKAAEMLARMPEQDRANAARLGFVTLGIRLISPSFVSDTVDITPEILAEETRIRETLAHANHQEHSVH